MSMSADAAGVGLAGVKKWYGQVPAVRNVSLAVEPGEMVCLLGPSGCGKTTTLRMVAGLENPDAGEIRIGDDAGQRPGAVEAQSRHGVPELRPVPAHDGF